MYTRFVADLWEYRRGGLTRLAVCAVVLLATVAPAYATWFRGRVSSKSSDEFAFHTRWWPRVVVKVLPSTEVRCNKWPFAVDDFRPDDDVEVVGDVRGGAIYAKRVKIHRKSSQCEQFRPSKHLKP